MKVLVLDEKKNHSYFLTFPKEMSQKNIKDMLEVDDHRLATFLLARKATGKITVPPKARKKAKLVANFTLAQGYRIERLA